ncbi:ABC transporter ATP-binding protein [Sulfitobacter sp. D35]|uniref:ABC transporter ATP-binding protein n=1 Tax=Sulfitobacter sp. D35 TaxID=3083252 RepID=UPI00296F42E6|nr:ABC transporter ATP-binding protein [Sulfitobacter sp. D35]MDW4496587.1 ABC transporter ATP-binding protein [Sulfitobacter sp. D35]
MASVTLENASKNFGAFTAVRDMNLAIDDAEFVAILGPSGCGKSTTMNMIAGIEDVSAGRIRFDDRDVTSEPMQKRGVGFVFQNYAIFTHMSVRKNLAFGLEVQGLPSAEIARRVDKMAEFMALTHRIDAPSASLSVNELQKLAIGRSAIVEPSIFLLDEPLSNLDAAFRERMRSDLRELQRSLKQTMIYVTHDQIEAMGLADRIAVMDQATLQQFDTPAQIYARPHNTFVAGFIGAPSMNLVTARISESGGSIFAELGGRPADRVALDARLGKQARISAATTLIFGFRPEHVQISDGDAAHAIAAQVALVEVVGRRKLVHFVSGETRFIGTFDRGLGIRPGETARLRFDVGKCSLFDAETGLRLRLSEAD